MRAPSRRAMSSALLATTIFCSPGIVLKLDLKVSDNGSLRQPVDGQVSHRNDSDRQVEEAIRLFGRGRRQREQGERFTLRSIAVCDSEFHRLYCWAAVYEFTNRFNLSPTLKKRRNLDGLSTGGRAAPLTGRPAASSG
jgi:hypothetical protein